MVKYNSLILNLCEVNIQYMAYVLIGEKPGIQDLEPVNWVVSLAN